MHLHCQNKYIKTQSVYNKEKEKTALSVGFCISAWSWHYLLLSLPKVSMEHVENEPVPEGALDEANL